MARRLENLTQHILSHARVQSSHIQGALVGLRGGAARDVAGLAAGGRHGVARHGRADGCGDGIVVLGDDDGGEGRRRHVLLGLGLVLVAGSTSRGRRGELCPGILLVGHCAVARTKDALKADAAGTGSGGAQEAADDGWRADATRTARQRRRRQRAGQAKGGGRAAARAGREQPWTRTTRKVGMKSAGRQGQPAGETRALGKRRENKRKRDRRCERPYGEL